MTAAAPDRLATLSLTDFAPLVGESFTLLEHPFALALEEAKDLGGTAPGGRTTFALVFAGPVEPQLPQGILGMEHASLGRIDIFLVPVSADGSHTRYEAIFA